MLVCGDLIPAVRGTSTARLRVPSLKKRTRERLTRERVIPAELAVVLGELIGQRRLDGRFTATALSRRPIFARTSESFESPERAHIGSDGVLDAVKRVQKALRLRSARTGLLMNLSPRRFRRTLGTRAADAGHSALRDRRPARPQRSSGMSGCTCRPAARSRTASTTRSRTAPSRWSGCSPGRSSPARRNPVSPDAASRRVGAGRRACGGHLRRDRSTATAWRRWPVTHLRGLPSLGATRLTGRCCGR